MEKRKREAAMTTETEGDPLNFNEDLDTTHPALLNDVVLQCICSHLAVKDLLDCRLVSKKFNTAAQAMLKQRRTYVFREWDCWEIPSLSELVELMDRNPDFPFLGFHLQEWKNRWEFHVDGYDDLIQKHGSKFRRLCVKDTFKGFGHEFCRFSSSIEELDVSRMYCMRPQTLKKEIREDLASLSLPSLKSLVLPMITPKSDAIPRFFDKCVRAAPNLKKIERLSFAWTPLLIRQEKLNIARSLTFRGAIDPTSCEKLLAAPPQLTKLNLQSCTSLEALKSILLASKKTLRELRLSSCPLPEELPVFEKLEHLHVALGSQDRLFPLDSAACFPVVKTVELVPPYACNFRRGRNNTESALLSRSLWSGPLDSVKKLDLKSFHQDGMFYLSQIFPNTSHLVIHDIHLGRTGCTVDQRDLWTWCSYFKLERLDLREFGGHVSHKANSCPYNIDSFLTGLSNDECERLATESSRTELLEELPRMYPGLLSLQRGLKEVNIVINYSCSHDKDVECPQLELAARVTAVASSYAFKLIPGLRVRFLYDHRHSTAKSFRKAFAHVTSCVEMAHEERPSFSL